MGHKVEEVCAECARKCLSLHGKMKNSSPVPSSFFKVMIGSDFSRVLYLPPKFGPAVSALVHKKAIIEDSSGQQWKVTVSIVNGSFAFQEGWNAFSLEHGLEVGDFLVFNYIGESHFIVKIYDKSACEKFDFSKKRKQKKRRRNQTGFDASDYMLIKQGSNASVVSVLDVEKMQSQYMGDDVDGTQNKEENTSKYNNSNGRAQSSYKAKNCEDPYYMTGRDFGDKGREDWNPMFDVFSYEILNNSGVDGTGKFTTNAKISHLIVSRNDASICNKDPLLEEILSRGATHDSSEFELTGRSHFLEEIDNMPYFRDRHSYGDKTPEHLLITSTVQHEENTENNSFMSNREVQKCQFADYSETDQAVILKERHALHIGSCQNPEQMINGIHESFNAYIHHRDMERMVKEELLDMTPDVCIDKDKLLSTGDMERMVKEELLDMTPDVCIDNDKLLSTCELFSLTSVLGAAHMLAFISQTRTKNRENGGAPSGSTEKIVAGPLP